MMILHIFVSAIEREKNSKGYGNKSFWTLNLRPKANMRARLSLQKKRSSKVQARPNRKKMRKNRLHRMKVRRMIKKLSCFSESTRG